jgi:hypothetical protein
MNIPDDAFAVPFADVTFGAESAAGKLSFENEIVEMDFPVDEHRFKGGLFISEGGSAILNFLRAISRARRILELLDRVGRLDLVRERVVRSQTRRLIVVFGIVERKRHRAELEIVVRKFRILLERRRLRVRSIMIRKNAVFSFCAGFFREKNQTKSLNLNLPAYGSIMLFSLILVEFGEKRHVSADLREFFGNEKLFSCESPSPESRPNRE